MKTKTKPEILTDNHLEFLDNLRESGVTNMFGAGPYLQRRFGLELKEASAVLGYWMDTFSDRHPATSN